MIRKHFLTFLIQNDVTSFPGYTKKYKQDSFVLRQPSLANNNNNNNDNNFITLRSHECGINEEYTDI